MALQLLELLPELINKRNGNAVSDVGVLGLSSECRSKGAMFNVEINLPGLPESMAEDIRQKSPIIKEDARILFRKIMDEVR